MMTAILLLLLLAVVVTLAQGQLYKEERPPFTEFLNYGKKKVKPGRELENEVIKSKVEVLGAILKTHIHRLRQVSLSLLILGKMRFVD